VTYLWTVAVMSASGAIVWRTLQMGNSMSSDTSHGVRFATSILAVLGLWGVLAPVSGYMHELAEPASWLLVGVGGYMLCDRRRPVARRETTEKVAV
jgi:hypothetical protein